MKINEQTLLPEVATRKLATIQEVERFVDIPGADKIQVALMKNWHG